MTKDSSNCPASPRFNPPQANVKLAQSGEYQVLVTDNTQPLNVTLVWTDAPGNPAVTAQLVNDLDLVVTHGASTYLGNRMFNGSSLAGGARDSVNGLFHVGSTAGVTTTEYEPGLANHDLKAAFERIAPEGGPYEHENTWQDDNGHAHVRASLLGPSLAVPFVDGRLTLGTPGWDAAEVDRFRAALQPSGWRVDNGDGGLVVSRAPGAGL